MAVHTCTQCIRARCLTLSLSLFTSAILIGYFHLADSETSRILSYTMPYFAHLVMVWNISYSRKYWWSLNLAVWPQTHCNKKKLWGNLNLVSHIRYQGALSSLIWGTWTKSWVREFKTGGVLVLSKLHLQPRRGVPDRAKSTTACITSLCVAECPSFTH